jgi:hypothetical protein
MPAVDSRGYPVKDSCVLEDVGLVAVFAGLASPQPGRLSHHTLQCTGILPLLLHVLCNSVHVTAVTCLGDASLHAASSWMLFEV